MPVTADNYAMLGSQFIANNSGRGFVIARRNVSYKDIEATPRQWAAWIGYLKRIGYSTGQIETRGYCTVPAEWPHAFDASAKFQDDLDFDRMR